MCNPRRIQVTATEQLNEAWEQEVQSTVELREQVAGTASLRRPLDGSLSVPVLRALEATLEDPASGWQRVEGGFRRDVDGGHVTYHAADRSLELTASLNEEITAQGEATRTLSGIVDAGVEAHGDASYYDDGYGGRDEAWAKSKAEEEARRQIRAKATERVEEAKRAAQSAAAPGLRSEAEARALEAMQRKAEDRRRELDAQARTRLIAVGGLGRQAFHRALGQAYRRVMLAYARANNAENVSCVENGDTIEIEFFVQR